VQLVQHTCIIGHLWNPILARKGEKNINMVSWVIYLIIINLKLSKKINFKNQIIIIFSWRIFCFYIILKSNNRCVIQLLIIGSTFYHHDYLISIFHLQVVVAQGCQHTNKVKNTFNFNLGPWNPKDLLGQKTNIWKLIFMGPPLKKKFCICIWESK